MFPNQTIRAAVSVPACSCLMLPGRTGREESTNCNPLSTSTIQFDETVSSFATNCSLWLPDLSSAEQN